MQCFSNIDIHQIINYLETFDYDLQKLNILVKFLKKWKVSKILFTRQIDINGSNEISTLLRPKINILTIVSFGDQLLLNCCCMHLYGDLMSKARVTFFSDPNILSGSFADLFMRTQKIVDTYSI